MLKKQNLARPYSLPLPAPPPHTSLLCVASRTRSASQLAVNFISSRPQREPSEKTRRRRSAWPKTNKQTNNPLSPPPRPRSESDAYSLFGVQRRIWDFSFYFIVIFPNCTFIFFFLHMKKIRKQEMKKTHTHMHTWRQKTWGSFIMLMYCAFQFRQEYLYFCVC